MRAYRLPAVLSLLLLALCVSASPVRAEEEGTIKIGALVEYQNIRDLNGGPDLHGTAPGLLLGYERGFGDDYWFAVEGDYTYGRVTTASDGVGPVDMGRVRTKGVVGGDYDFYGLTYRPYLGAGVNWEAEDAKGAGNSYMTEYVLPIGTKIEKRLDAGLLGLDLEYQYVLRREIYSTTGDETWGSRNFDGSYNLEAGFYFEPAALPMGFRPYYRFCKYQKTKYWDSMERNQVGLETYVRF
jgi:hypothetical protein